jgi:hypothetical protein
VEQVVLENIDTFTSESGLGDDEDEDIAALTEAANSLRAAISQTSDPDERTILAAVAVEGLSRVAQDAEIPIAEEIGQIHQSLNSSISSLPFHSPLRQSFAETPIRPESLVRERAADLRQTLGDTTLPERMTPEEYEAATTGMARDPTFPAVSESSRKAAEQRLAEQTRAARQQEELDVALEQRGLSRESQAVQAEQFLSSPAAANLSTSQRQSLEAELS